MTKSFWAANKYSPNWFKFCLSLAPKTPSPSGKCTEATKKPPFHAPVDPGDGAPGMYAMIASSLHLLDTGVLSNTQATSRGHSALNSLDCARQSQLPAIGVHRTLFLRSLGLEHPALLEADGLVMLVRLIRQKCRGPRPT
eukprot:8889347-Pyramimonas_sp.AAC.1